MNYLMMMMMTDLKQDNGEEEGKAVVISALMATGPCLRNDWTI